jgi:hypothetical protein
MTQLRHCIAIKRLDVTVYSRPDLDWSVAFADGQREVFTWVTACQVLCCEITNDGGIYVI